MEIWILNHYAVPPQLPGGTRHYDLGRELVRRGHRVTIFASSFHYGYRRAVRQHRGLRPVVEDHAGVRFVWVPSLSYQGNTLKRLANLLSYSVVVLPAALGCQPPVPDVVLGSSVHPFAVFSGWLLSRRFGVPLVTEIRDLWPQTLIDSGFPSYHPFILLLGWLERFLYRHSHSVVTVLPRAREYMLSAGAVQVDYIPNGIDMAGLEPPEPPPPRQEFVVMYAGTLGQVNHLNVVVETARRLRYEHSEIRFVLIGDGPYRAALQESARELPNLILRDPVPKKELPGVLREADVLLFHLKAVAVFRYGISPNKLFDYLAAGRPILFACQAGNDPVSEAGAGLSVPPEDPDALARGVVELAELPPESRHAMGLRGYRYVQAHHSIPVLADRYEEVLAAATRSICSQ